MTHYHLNLHNAHVDAPDGEGHELPDLSAAREMALHGIRDFLAHEVKQGRLDLQGRVDVADDSGQVLASVAFVDAAAIISPGG